MNQHVNTISGRLLNTLGYRSEKTLELDGSPEAFLDQFSTGGGLHKDKTLFDHWESVHILFQFTAPSAFGARQPGKRCVGAIRQTCAQTSWPRISSLESSFSHQSLEAAML